MNDETQKTEIDAIEEIVIARGKSNGWAIEVERGYDTHGQIDIGYYSTTEEMMQAVKALFVEPVTGHHVTGQSDESAEPQQSESDAEALEAVTDDMPSDEALAEARRLTAREQAEAAPVEPPTFADIEQEDEPAQPATHGYTVTGEG